MDDTELYTKLLGIPPPWRVTRVTVGLAAERIDVSLEEAAGMRFPCATCTAPALVYDHTAASARRTCTRPPRTACPMVCKAASGGFFYGCLTS